MSVLEKIRAQGFSLRPVIDGLYIEPIDALTAAQRQWLIDNKPQIRTQLLAERWSWFLSLATEHGIHPDVVAAEFPTDQDRLDVIEPEGHDDEILHEWMAMLCRDTRVKRRQRYYEAGTWLPVNADGEALP